MIKNNNEKLYHKEVFWKKYFDREALKLVQKVTESELSSHIKKERLENPDEKHPYDFNGLSKAISRIKNGENAYLFEVAEVNGIVLKAVYRVTYNNEKDISVVIRKDKDRVFIVTAWVNYKNDKHFTLDKTKYSVI